MQEELFEPRRLNLATIIEADQEASISTLVKAGIGIGLMRADLADAAERAGEIFVWRNDRKMNFLSFFFNSGPVREISAVAR